MGKKNVGPVVRHTTITPDKEKLDTMIRKFLPAVIAHAHKKRERDGWEDFKDEKNLLALRKELLKVVRHGMLGRKDLEEEIALLACVIWSLRKQHRKNILDTVMEDFE